MKKKVNLKGLYLSNYFRKIWMIMRVTLLLMISFFVNISASTFAQSQKVFLNVKNVALQEVFEELESQTKLSFIYSNEIVNEAQLVSVKAEGSTLNEVLNSLLEKQNLEFKIVENKILILSSNEALLSNNRMQEKISVTGIVTDDKGEPLPGVNVYEKTNQQHGVITGVDGSYSLTDVDPNSTLVFSFIGFVDQEINVSGRSNIKVILISDMVDLGEVVVTALGIEKSSKALSYSVTEVDGQSISDAQEISAGNALIGKVAGVDVTSSGSGVAGATKIRIRGNSSLTSNNEPLYIVDGVPMDNTIVAGGDAMSSLNPDDIESLSVLKGNSASALYGARAANGVVMITTKSGAKRKGLGVEFSSSYAYDNMINVFTDRQKEYGVGLGGNKSTNFGFETHRAWGAKYDGSAGEYPDGTPTTYDYKEDHIDQFFRGGNTFTNNIALTGGNDVQTFRLSASNMQHDDIVPNSEMDRNTFALSTQGKYGEKLTVNAKISYSNQKVKNRPDLWRTVWPLLAIPTMWEIEHFKGPTDKWGAKEDGRMYNFSTNDYILNPYWSLYQNEKQDVRDKIIATGLIKYDFTDWLYLQGKIGTDFSTIKASSIDAYGAMRTAPQGKGRVQEWTETIRETNAEYMIGFDKPVGALHVNAFFGGNTMRRHWERDGASGVELQIPHYHVLQNASVLSTMYGYNARGINSIFGSAEIAYQSMLYLSATGRKDWFSTMPKDQNSVFYPSVGASFVFTQALQMPEWLTFGKVRTSWAQVGGGAPSPYSTKFSYGIDAIGHMGVPLASISNTLPNPDLKPYLSSEIEFGIDLRMFNGRLGVDYAYYTRNTTDNITNIALTTSSGYSSAIVNLAEFNSWGHELMITATPVKRSLVWDVAFIYNYNMSEVIETGSDSGEIALQGMGKGGTMVKHIEGEPAFAITSYKQVEQGGQKVWKYDAGRNVYGPLPSEDREIIGYGFHPHGMSLNNSFAWKDFDLNILIDGKFGGSIFSEINQTMTRRGHHIRTLGGGVDGVSGDRENGLTLEGVFLDANGDPADLNALPPTVDPASFENFYRRVYAERVGALDVYDASYIKLRQITFGYNLPKKLIGSTPLNNLRISVYGKNLFNLMDNLPNSDPAFADTQPGNIAGLSYYPIPSVRTFGVKLNVGF